MRRYGSRRHRTSCRHIMEAVDIVQAAVTLTVAFFDSAPTNSKLIMEKAKNSINKDGPIIK